MKLYEALAQEIEDLVSRQALRPGDRLPSVRQQQARRGVSPATVFQAYYLLEARGVIESRPRSGYYVARRRLPDDAPPEPHVSQPAFDAAVVDVSALVFDVLGAARNRSAIPFGSAFPSPLLFPLERLARETASAMRRLDPWSTVADLAPGNDALRRQIALRYQLDGAPVPPDDIVITNGAMEALNLCLQAVTRPGDAVLVESPAFYAALQALERLGLRAVEVATDPRDGMEIGALAQALERHRPAACWLMTSFQNPLGCLMPAGKKQAVVELLARHQVPLIEDDVYGELYFGARRPALAKRYDQHGLVMHCGSFSKCLAPGFRIGWASPGRHAKAVERLKLSTSLACAMPSQLALAGYLAQGGYDRHLRQLRSALEAQRDAMLMAVARHFPAGTRATRPEGGYFLWVELPAGADALALQRAALERGISIAPGPMFSARREFGNCLRLNYGHLWNAELEDAMAVLGRLARA
ncbi:PLP-dependent aminotransferase family protein [Pseudoduganella ginsengisoli]|uniref:Aminotransferase class I/II-fold pyridoxal phosphate-dependent enzyme n=1 Tax=Pseudoduganella ginsengisoli TaxID=1462440 RepID=A0A6L6Q1Z9_9BURK|nr:PLP-dependent aminotransferase family protein [Pseudoduganella ginsengisoli]MTW03341.1 aminotransferase class I/II-fold pyridoxal phosphate-dependent enzyme [Pseudoduganella ginsengisoli]